MPSLATASPELRERMINGTPLTHAQRAERQNRASSEGRAMAAGTSLLLSPDGEWDRMLLDAFAAGQLTVLDEESEASIIEKGGRGAHEIRVWIAALAALKQGYQATELFYEPVSEWITGMGILVSTES
jgi:2,3-dihydroxyphenylpropionate 1,2-dioxygenase